MPILSGSIISAKDHHQYFGYWCALFSEGDQMFPWEIVNQKGNVAFDPRMLRVSPATLTHAVVWDRPDDFHKILVMDIPITVTTRNSPIQLSIPDVGFG